MDLGREVCQSRSVYCELCQLRSGCSARSWDDPTSTPYVSEKKKIVKEELKLLRIVCEEDGKIFCYKKPKGTWLAGQYEIPTFVVDKKDESIKQYPYVEVVDVPKDLLKTGITKYKVFNYYKKVNSKDLKSIGDFELLDLSLAKKKLSTASIKILNELNIF